MPEYLAPGVYVEEVPVAPQAIEGVPTSTAAFLGVAERGPVEPQLVTSFTQYQTVFGGACGAHEYLPDAVQGFFENGAQRVYVCNIASGHAGTRPVPADFEGRASADRPTPQGFAALESDAFKDVALVYAPGRPDVASLAVAHCRRMRFRFAVIDADRDAPLAGLDAGATPGIDSFHAACYGPWLLVQGANAGERRLVPPCGHVLGIYARTDASRGVFKAPANEVVQGALGLQSEITTRQQELLVEQGLNVIRSFPGRGIRVWGARTLSSNPEWKYVNVRRYAMFLEHSILEGTRWVVSEPNAPPLWARVGDMVRQFLRGQWRLGALQGAKEEHAFHVACGVGVSMSEDDVRDGRLVCEVGVAMLRPAEFTLLRITQRTAPAEP